MPATPEKTIATSLKLPASVKAQIDQSAAQAGMTAHAYMVRTLAKTAERARLRAQWDADTQEAWDELQTSGMAYRFDEVRAYFTARAKGEQVAPPELKPWRGADKE